MFRVLFCKTSQKRAFPVGKFFSVSALTEKGLSRSRYNNVKTCFFAIFISFIIRSRTTYVFIVDVLSIVKKIYSYVKSVLCTGDMFYLLDAFFAIRIST